MSLRIRIDTMNISKTAGTKGRPKQSQSKFELKTAVNPEILQNSECCNF